MKTLFAAILGCLLLASLCVRLTQPEQQSDRPILYWKSDSNPQRYEQIDLFHKWLVEKGHVDAEGRPVVELRLDSANTQSKLIQAVSGVGGDIIDAYVRGFESLGVLSDLSEYGRKLGFGVEGTYPGLADLLTVDGKLYGFPCNVNVVGYWCNADTFEKLGMEPPPEVWDPDTFERIGKEFVKRANAGQSRQTVFFAESPTGWPGARLIVVMHRSLGLDNYNETRTRCILNDPRYVQTLERLYKWTYKDHLFPSAAEVSSMSAEAGYGGGGLALLKDGKYGMITIGRWCLIRIRSFDDPPALTLSRFPQWDFPNMVISARCATLYAGSEHPDEAALFFAFLNDASYNDYITAQADGLPPNPGYVVGNPKFEHPAAHPNEGDTSAIEARWANTIGYTMPYCRYFRATGSDWKQYGLDMVFNNKGTAAEAAAETERRINADIDRTVARNPELRAVYERDLKTQAKIDQYKAEGRKLPVAWIKNPFYVAYYREKGMLENSDGGMRNAERQPSASRTLGSETPQSITVTSEGKR